MSRKKNQNLSTKRVYRMFTTAFSATATHLFEDHLFHEVAIVFASLIGAFVAYASWRSYKVSGEVFLRWLTVGLLSFTVIYMPHGILTRTAHHNIWLFLLFGPVSRLAMLGCVVYGLTQYGKPAESPNEITQRGFWRNVMVACGASILFVAVLAYSPVASSSWVRLPMEMSAIALCLLGLASILFQKIRSPLMKYVAVALALFAQAAFAFILSKPWSHMWWLAHVIFAAGFSVMGWGVVRALLTTRSFSMAFSEEQLMRALEQEKACLMEANDALRRTDALLISSNLSLKKSLQAQEALLKEVHHRVKNNLQVITSLLRLEAGRSTIANTKEVLGYMRGRIRTMAQLHESLYRSDTFASVDLGVYLGQVATQAFKTQELHRDSVRLTLNLRSVQAGMDQATVAGLLLNELVSNCLKHGFPEGRTGEVCMELQAAHDHDSPHDGRWCLRVSDTGVGLPSDFEDKRKASLGMQLVTDLSHQLGGSLAIDSVPGQGVRFSVVFVVQAPAPLVMPQ